MSRTRLTLTTGALGIINKLRVRFSFCFYAAQLTGAADLGKGERYIAMPWFIWDTNVAHEEVMLRKEFILHYDVACQWKNRAAAVGLTDGEQGDHKRAFRSISFFDIPIPY